MNQEDICRSFTSDEVDALRAADAVRISELEQRIESASIAASETAPSWKHRCHRILGALGFDYGDPDWLMPGDRRRLEAALTRIAELEEKLHEREMPLGEIERLLDAEQALERHHVGHDGSFLPDVWYVRSNDTPQKLGVRLSAHPTRWEAIAAAEIADRRPEEPTPLRNA